MNKVILFFFFLGFVCLTSCSSDDSTTQEKITTIDDSKNEKEAAENIDTDTKKENPEDNADTDEPVDPKVTKLPFPIIAKIDGTTRNYSGNSEKAIINPLNGSVLFISSNSESDTTMNMTIWATDLKVGRYDLSTLFTGFSTGLTFFNNSEKKDKNYVFTVRSGFIEITDITNRVITGTINGLVQVTEGSNLIRNTKITEGQFQFPY